MTQRIKVTIAYDGAAFAGWQLQAGRPQPTIQGVIEKALFTLEKKRIVIHGSGRTDSGVHAEGQVFHFDIPQKRENLDWERFFTATLPPAIQIVAVEKVDKSFHARFDAMAKRYDYVIWADRKKAPPKLAPYVWSVPPVDIGLMNKAANTLLGEHDFASFQNSGSNVDDTVRRINSIVHQAEYCAPFVCPHLPVWTWSIEGNGFLRQMVRNIMGLLVWVGAGKIRPEEIPAIMAACDRKALPSPAAPGHGLTLAKVYYP